eukprot:COSAG02_NODE_1527_length_12090_cov_4.316070_7_plen_153_part_00
MHGRGCAELRSSSTLKSNAWERAQAYHADLIAVGVSARHEANALPAQQLRLRRQDRLTEDRQVADRCRHPAPRCAELPPVVAVPVRLGDPPLCSAQVLKLPAGVGAAVLAGEVEADLAGFLAVGSDAERGVLHAQRFEDVLLEVEPQGGAGD